MTTKYFDYEDDDFDVIERKHSTKKMKSSKLEELNENKRKKKFKTKTLRKFTKDADE